MVLKEDAPLGNLAPVLRLPVRPNAPRRVLRRLHKRLELGRAAVVLQDLLAVEPMLDVRPFGHDHAAVPLARPLEDAVRVRRDDVVERGGLAVAVPAFVGVWMSVLEDLVLLARSLVERLVVEVLDARVGVLGEAEVELEREVAVLPRGDDISAAAKLLVLRGKREPLSVRDSVDRAHRERSVLDVPSLRRRLLAAALHGEPSVERLSVPRELPALGLLHVGERVRALGRGLHLRLGLDRVAYAAPVADALDDGEEVVVEVRLELERADAVVADVRERLEHAHEVDLAAGERDGLPVRRVLLEVLDVRVVDARSVLPDRLGGILVAAVLPADVDAEADSAVKVLDEVPAVLDVGEELADLRAVVVDRVLDVELLYELVDPEEKRTRSAALLAVRAGNLLERNADNRLHAEALRELEAAAHVLYPAVINGTYRIRSNAVGGALRLERSDLFVRRGERKMEVLYAQIVYVGLLHDRERVVDRAPVEREPGDAEPERHRGAGEKRYHQRESEY